MSIWNIIRDWFVQYIFGGFNSNMDFYDMGVIGNLANKDGSNFFIGSIGDTYVPVKLFNEGSGAEICYITLGDWLSTTATLIVIIAVCFGLFMLVRYFFRMFSGLLTLK